MRYRYTVEQMDGKKGFVFRSDEWFQNRDDSDPEWKKICESFGFESKDVEIIRIEERAPFPEVGWKLLFDPTYGIW